MVTIIQTTKILDFLEEKVILFSDLHIGVRTDSDVWHKTAIEYSLWLKDKALKNNINTLLFLGDFFHDREEIRLTSLHTANLFLENLKDFNIIMIIGNHDCYYKDKTDVNSISIFDKWKNIVVVKDLEVLDFLNKKIAFIPWGSDIEKLPDGVDYAFGHIEIESFRINKVKICEHGVKSSDLLKKINKLYSGHFHIRSKKSYDSGSIEYIGNTFEQNWSDYEEEKGIEIFSFNTGKTTFIKNDISPKHIKVQLSKLLSKDEKEIKNFKENVKSNIVKLIIDEEIPQEKLSLISEKISKLNPIAFNSEVTNESETKSVDDFESVEIDLKLLLMEYIEKLEIQENKDKILSETIDIYNKALTQVKDDTI
jgi:DNA repair exonuclease SbcCD nuclease subunit